MYVPERGDVVMMNFSPQTGVEQSGRRPGLVISPGKANQVFGLFFVCPITSKIKDYPFEVAFKSPHVSGAVLVNHMKSLDWKNRHLEKLDTLDPQTFQEVIGKLGCLVF